MESTSERLRIHTAAVRVLELHTRSSIYFGLIFEDEETAPMCLRPST